MARRVRAPVAAAGFVQPRLDATFDQRAEDALAHDRRTGEFHPADAVMARWLAMLDARRQSITPGSPPPPMQNPPDAG